MYVFASEFCLTLVKTSACGSRLLLPKKEPQRPLICGYVYSLHSAKLLISLQLTFKLPDNAQTHFEDTLFSNAQQFKHFITEHYDISPTEFCIVNFYVDISKLLDKPQSVSLSQPTPTFAPSAGSFSSTNPTSSCEAWRQLEEKLSQASFDMFNLALVPLVEFKRIFLEFERAKFTSNGLALTEVQPEQQLITFGNLHQSFSTHNSNEIEPNTYAQKQFDENDKHAETFKTIPSLPKRTNSSLTNATKSLASDKRRKSRPSLQFASKTTLTSDQNLPSTQLAEKLDPIVSYGSPIKPTVRPTISDNPIKKFKPSATSPKEVFIKTSPKCNNNNNNNNNNNSNLARCSPPKTDSGAATAFNSSAFSDLAFSPDSSVPATEESTQNSHQPTSVAHILAAAAEAVKHGHTILPEFCSPPKANNPIKVEVCTPPKSGLYALPPTPYSKTLVVDSESENGSDDDAQFLRDLTEVEERLDGANDDDGGLVLSPTASACE